MSKGKGCIRLGRVAGITLFLHWSWFLVAVLEINLRSKAYRSLGWNVAEYLVLFGIVLLHEFGHAFACRQTGGTAEQIVLWPLGGVAFVNPPPRPGALLWSIAAGPLVNVLLVPVTIGLWLLLRHASPAEFFAPLKHFCAAVAIMNLVLLVFNLLPIYPLDGGQILFALLWFVLGRARGLLVASVVGMVGAAGVLLLALAYWNLLGVAIAVFLGFQAMNGLRQARILGWLQPALEHLRRAASLIEQRRPAEAVAECDRALELIPEGNRLRATVQNQRAVALAGLAGPPATLCPACRAALTPPETSGIQVCWNCGWKSGPQRG
jgi:Zn-dependent protease